MGHKVEVMVHGQYFVGFLSIPSAASSTHWDISPKNVSNPLQIEIC